MMTPTNPSQERQRRERLGRRAEMIAAMWLRLKGYSILDQRVKLKVGEIDLVARRGKVIVFVEVKARATTEKGLDAVPSHAWNRIARAAAQWMAKRPALSEAAWRYDLVTVTGGLRPQHHPDFWRPEPWSNS